MSLSGIERTGSIVRTTLRAKTDATHQRMHHLKPFAEIAAGTLPLAQYRQLLQSLLLFHRAVERQAQQAGVSQLSSSGHRVDLLRSDLCYLGGDEMPAPVSGWQAGAGGAALGALYAAEGSMLGGRVIARQLDYAFGAGEDGRRFFIGEKSHGATWSRLLVVLEDSCSEPSALEDAIRGALSTFAWFEHCVKLPN